MLILYLSLQNCRTYRVVTTLGGLRELLKDSTELPIAAYNVSGEYAMVKAAIQKGWLNDQRAITEVLTSIRRAGATAILTYHAKEVLEKGWL